MLTKAAVPMVAIRRPKHGARKCSHARNAHSLFEVIVNWQVQTEGLTVFHTRRPRCPKFFLRFLHNQIAQRVRLIANADPARVQPMLIEADYAAQAIGLEGRNRNCIEPAAVSYTSIREASSPGFSRP